MFVCLMLISNSILQSYGRVHVPVFTMLIGGVVKIIFNYNLTAVPSINIHAAPFGTLVCFVIVRRSTSFSSTARWRISRTTSRSLQSR